VVSLFAAVLQGLGLSQRAAAEYLGTRIDSVKAWESGKSAVPAGVWGELRALADRQETAATAACEAWEAAGEPASVQLGVASDDSEARQLGWPSAESHLAVARRVWEMLDGAAEVRVVPRGSTVATAAAIEAREKRR